MDWNIIEILTMKEVDSNNHALNSILMKFCYFFFGSSELSLRLPNLIAGSLFIIYSLRISKLFGSSFILGSLIVLLGNHHLIDFFSIARGYGLALAFQLISIFHIIKYHQNHKLQDFILFGLALVFSCLSNLSFVAYATGALFFSGLIQIFSIEKKFLELFRYLTLLTLLWAVCFIPIYKMQQINMLNFGGDIGFYNDTILSLVQRAINHIRPWDTMIILSKLIGILSICITILISFFSVLKVINLTHNKLHFNLAFFNLLLIGLAVGHIALFHAFDIMYTKERFALYFYPIFVIQLILLFKYISQTRFKKMGEVLEGFLLLIIISLSAGAFNISHTNEWKYDCKSEVVFEVIKSSNDKINVDWHFQPSIEFYKKVNSSSFELLSNPNELGSDYYYVFKFDIPDGLEYEMLLDNQLNNTVLVRSNF
jgi:hypothetical protein